MSQHCQTKHFCRRRASRLQIIVRQLTRKGHVRGVVHLLLVLSQEGLVDLGSWGSQSRGGNELLQ